MSVSDTKWLDSFFASPYNYYDAELLAQLWKLESVQEAKILIGAKILNGNEDILPDKVRAGSKASVDEGSKMLNHFFDSAYTYEDAALLAQLWNIDLVEAKKTIGYKVFAGLERFLPDKIRHHDEGDLITDTKALDTFFNSPYTYDDANLLAQLWNIDLVEAKKTIGYKLLSDLEKLLPDKIRHTPEPTAD